LSTTIPSPEFDEAEVAAGLLAPDLALVATAAEVTSGEEESEEAVDDTAEVITLPNVTSGANEGAEETTALTSAPVPQAIFSPTKGEGERN
jgi:hypothetical protein